MAHHGKTHLTFIMACPPEHVDEGKSLFAAHDAWMKSTHHRDGDAALLSYDVSIGPELANPMDSDSAPTGRTVFVLSEIYESPKGVADHFEQASKWSEFPALAAWLEKCEVAGIPGAPIVNSMW